MSMLAKQQQAMLAVLFDWPSHSAIKKIANYTVNTGSRGLKIYQSNGHVLAQRALQAAYPVLAQLLGAESFDALARAHWHTEPPTCGDVAEWGVGLPAFVRGSAQLQDEPYLGDLAALEWALHCASIAADAEVDAASFALLAAHDPAELHVQLAPGCAVVASVWPVASLWAAHADQSVPFDALRQRFQAQSAEVALVWRAGLRPQVRHLDPAEHALLTALLANQTLGAALDAASHGAALATQWDTHSWLAQAVQSGLLLSVRA